MCVCWLNGKLCHSLLCLVSAALLLQGMDSVRRFTAQHIEFEAEWETAFNIQLKLHDCITLMIKWCSSSESVLVRAYSMVLEHLPCQSPVSTTAVCISHPHRNYNKAYVPDAQTCCLSSANSFFDIYFDFSGRTRSRLLRF